MGRDLQSSKRPVGADVNDGAGRDGAEERPFYVIGHRGSPCSEVENTIQSFERAVEVDGANALELDLCLTSDGVPVVWHDWDPEESICIARCSGLEPDVKFCPRLPDDSRYRRPVNKLTFLEFIENFGYGEKDSDCSRVDAYIPSFEELIHWAVGKPQLQLLFLDIKIPKDDLQEVPRLVECVERTIERASPRFRVIYETAHEEVLDAMKRVNPKGTYTLDKSSPAGIVLNPSRFSAVEPAIRNGNAFATLERPRSITLAPWWTYKRIVRHDMALRRRHERTESGKPIEGVVCYTINEEKEMRKLIRMGVDGIQTDKPDLLFNVAHAMRKVRADGHATSAARDGRRSGAFNGAPLPAGR